jgi:hypothetical protein
LSLEPIVCLVCGQSAAEHRGRLQSIASSRAGVLIESLFLCEHHMAMVLNLLAAEMTALAIDPRKLPMTFSLGNWAPAEEMLECDLCGRTFYTRAEASHTESIVDEWPPVTACARCCVGQYRTLFGRLKNAASLSDSVSLTRVDAITYLRTQGKAPWPELPQEPPEPPIQLDRARAARASAPKKKPRST